jgi:predicted DsbA family dithiol-disulfide isomerase
MLVEIWSDVVCPWCYIGKHRFEAALARFEHAAEVDVRWRSFELDPRAPLRRTRSYAEHVAGKYGMAVEEAEARLVAMNDMAAAEGLRMDLGRTNGGNTLAAHRLVHLAAAQDPALAGALEEALFEAYFTELRAIGDAEVLLEVAVATGLPEAEVEALLASDRFVQEVRHDEQQAAELGCTGVPFSVFDRKLAVPGAQDPETFLAVLRRVWAKSHAVAGT